MLVRKRKREMEGGKGRKTKGMGRRLCEWVVVSSLHLSLRWRMRLLEPQPRVEAEAAKYPPTHPEFCLCPAQNGHLFICRCLAPQSSPANNTLRAFSLIGFVESEQRHRQGFLFKALPSLFPPTQRYDSSHTQPACTPATKIQINNEETRQATK